MLSIKNLEVVYDDVVLVLRGVSLEVPEGKIVALLGANGAGKTTLLRAVTGLLDIHEGEITKGSISLNGTRIDGLRAPKVVQNGIRQVPEGRRIFAELTVDENLRAGAYSNSKGTKERFERVYGLFPVLKQRRRSTAGYLSGGEQQMLSMARGLMSDPKYLLLDEPSLGLAPQLVQQIRDLIIEINEQGTSVLLVEQNARMALAVSEHGYIMENGKVVMDKPSQELREDEDVKEFYLGLHKEGDIKSFRDVKHYKRRKRWLS